MAGGNVKVEIGGGSGTDPDAIHDNVDNEISGIVLKASPEISDLGVLEDQSDSGNKKRFTLGTIPKIDNMSSPVDNAVIRANGTGGQTVQDSLATIDDSGGVNIPSGQQYKVNGSQHQHVEADITDLSDIFHDYPFFADQMFSPVQSEWSISGITDVAVCAVDTNNNALQVRLFDDTNEEGAGVIFRIPDGATNIILEMWSRAETAPGSVQTVVPSIWYREIPDNAAVEAFSTRYNLTAISIPASENFQKDEQIIALSTLSLIAGRVCQLEISRNTGSGSDTLSGDWDLLLLHIRFS